MDRGQCHREPARRIDPRLRRRRAQARDRLQRSQRPARPLAGTPRTRPDIQMRKREHPGEPGRRQPVHHGRRQLLDSEHIHVVPPHNAKDRGRVSRTAQRHSR